MNDIAYNHNYALNLLAQDKPTQARIKRAWARRKCLELWHRSTMRPAFDPADLLFMASEVCALLAEAAEDSKLTFDLVS